MKKFAILVIAMMTVVFHSPVSAATSTTADDTPESNLRVAPASIAIATYQGRTIDLRDGWGTARACRIDDSGTNCFDSEKEMDAFISASDPGAVSGLAHSLRAVLCGSDLRLYDGISYGSLVASIGTRLTVINLSSLGVDNMTTSYKVGACSASMWNGASATGSLYPGNTSAGAVSPNMVTGWNNTISSVYVG